MTKLKIKFNKKKIIIILIFFIMIFVLGIMCVKPIKIYKINKQIIANTNLDEKITTVFTKTQDINIYKKTLEHLKVNELDLQVISSMYDVIIQNEYIKENNKVNITIDKYSEKENSIKIIIGDSIYNSIRINVDKYFKDVKYVDEYILDNGLLCIDKGLLIDESGYVTINNLSELQFVIAFTEITNIEVKDIVINKGATKNVEFIIEPEDYTYDIFTFEYNKEALEINDNNEIIGKIVGNYEVAVKTSNSKINKVFNVNVLESVESIEVDKLTVELMRGNKLKLNANPIPEEANNKELIWSSSNENIVTVDNDGNITGVGNGECEIEVSTKEAPIIKTKIQVSVKSNVPTNTPGPQIEGITYINGILLVNKTHSVPSGYSPGMQKDVLNAFYELQAGAKNAGHDIQLLSGYRSYETQARLYSNYVATYGQASADTFSARPGTSEHQTGLAMDVGWIDDAYAYTESGKWLAANAHRYGFIIRYMKGKEHITGYKYEPWHIRYLGKDIAKQVYESGLCLEEFLGV